MPDITDYTDYRHFYRAWVAERPKQRSQRIVAGRVGVTPSTISMILTRKRRLSVDDARAWGEAMKLEGDDLLYWVALVRARHGTSADRREAWLEIRARRNLERARPVATDDALFGSWHLWAIHELARCDGFVPDAEILSKRLYPPVDPALVARDLEALTREGLLRPDASGILRPTDAAVHALNDANLRRMHREHLSHAADVLALPPEDRCLLTIVTAVPKAALPELQDRLRSALRQALAGMEGSADAVVEIGLQVIPRTSPGGAP